MFIEKVFLLQIRQESQLAVANYPATTTEYHLSLNCEIGSQASRRSVRANTKNI